MRLIDAESLSSMRFTHKMHDSEGRLYVPFDEVAEAIFNAPTIEAEPVKHGRWIHDYDDVLISGACSVCGWHSIIMETDVADMPYCPNCGAKMDAEEGETHDM